MDDQVVELLTRILAGLTTALSVVFGWLMRSTGQRLKDKETDILHERKEFRERIDEIREEHNRQVATLKDTYEERLNRHKEIITEKENHIILLQERVEAIYIEFLKKLNGKRTSIIQEKNTTHDS